MVGWLTRWVLRHRLVVVVVWVALAFGGATGAESLGSAFSKQVVIPGKAIAKLRAACRGPGGRCGD